MVLVRSKDTASFGGEKKIKEMEKEMDENLDKFRGLGEES